MYDMFMLIAGIIFVVLTIVTAFMFAVAMMVAKKANEERQLYKNGSRKLLTMHKRYMDAIQRSNETVVEKFRHDLDCHIGEQSK